ncbi:hypothetical protein HMPREF9997_00588 [Corynebacterium durum F0235]|uniref:Uncharacterized protein n=1 Tax=Corynebacterium durum F0235 TaxID=1035195 RepID=L1MJQ2_9CORY|nr:hypothetical protein HMPREF9997_00588 [Corynebacterium durum F0235]
MLKTAYRDFCDYCDKSGKSTLHIAPEASSSTRDILLKAHVNPTK